MDHEYSNPPEWYPHKALTVRQKSEQLDRSGSMIRRWCREDRYVKPADLNVVTWLQVFPGSKTTRWWIHKDAGHPEDLRETRKQARIERALSRL